MSVVADHGARDLSARDRRERIVELVEIDQRVSVADLKERFNVTDASIRRDLTILERAGRLRRVHGGAVGRGAQLTSGVFATKLRARREQKARIGAFAARLVRRGEVVFFDSGTTVAQVAAQMPPVLRTPNAITAVTHSLPVIEEIGSWDGPHLVCLGGLYLPDYRAFVGPQAIASLRELTADVDLPGLRWPDHRERPDDAACAGRGGRRRRDEPGPPRRRRRRRLQARPPRLHTHRAAQRRRRPDHRHSRRTPSLSRPSATSGSRCSWRDAAGRAPIDSGRARCSRPRERGHPGDGPAGTRRARIGAGRPRRRSGRPVAQPADRAPRPAPYGAHFDDWWSGGWDEIFPSGDRGTLHDELAAVHGRALVRALGGRALDADGDEASITAVGLGTIAPGALRTSPDAARRRADPAGPLSDREPRRPAARRITWGIHPAFAVTPAHRIDHPGRDVLVGFASDPSLGVAGERYRWPDLPDPSHPTGVRDMRRVRPREDAVFGGHWVTDLADGWLAVTDTCDPTRRGAGVRSRDLPERLAVAGLRWLARPPSRGARALDEPPDAARGRRCRWSGAVPPAGRDAGDRGRLHHPRRAGRRHRRRAGRGRFHHAVGRTGDCPAWAARLRSAGAAGG